MPKQKTNQGPCSIYNCNKESTIFRSLTDNAFAKALAIRTLQQYSYLQINQQIYPLPQLSLADKIKKMTTIIYNRQRKESATLILEPNSFKKMLEESDSDLIEFFDEI
ncbi:5341_t:CDS:2, partial [Dentiscutata erythropus]